jgi:hypothetical protein
MNVSYHVLAANRLNRLLKEDQRIRPREEIHANMRYQPEGTEAFREGVLHNISETGALISCAQNLDPGTRIHIVMPSENPNEFAIHIGGVIVRKISEPGVDISCYGCSIERIQDPN